MAKVNSTSFWTVCRSTLVQMLQTILGMGYFPFHVLHCPSERLFADFDHFPSQRDSLAE